jgi:hypothetical protein
MSTGRVIHNEEQLVTYPSGMRCIMQLTKIPHFDEFGNIIGLLSISHIVDDRNQHVS